MLPEVDVHLNLETILLFGTAILFLSWLFRRQRNLPPGPWGFPLIGCIPNLALSFYRTGLQPHQLLIKMTEDHGSVLSMYIGGKLVVVLHKFKTVKDAFRTAHIIGRPHVALFDELGANSAFPAASGEAWKQQRTFTMATLRSFGVGKRSFEESISEESKCLAEEIVQLSDTPFDPRHYFTNATSNVICAVVFGKRFEYSDPDFSFLLEKLDKIFQLVGASGAFLFFPSVKYIQRSTYTKLKDNVIKITKFIAGIVEEHEAVRDQDYPNDYIDVYLNEIETHQKLGSNAYVSSRNLPFTVLNLFGAGTETTSTTLRWAVLYMMAYPDIQDRVQKEIDSVAGRDRLPRLSDKDDLQYTAATLLEVQRIVTVATLGIAHVCSEATTVEGYTIPQGSIVIANLWAIHHDPDIWEEPNKFKPERFLDEAGRLREREELIPFSTGRRICPGEHLAKMELYIFFTHLLHQFTFKKPQNSPPLSFEGKVGLVKSPGEFLTQAIKRE